MLEALSSSDVEPSRVAFLSGEAGLRALDPADQRHGLFARLKRAVESVSMEGPALQASTEALEAGKTVVSVTDTSESEAEVVRQAIIAVGASETFYFGRWTITSTGVVGSEPATE